MLPYHSLPVRLPIGVDTMVFFSRAPAGRLIVFVHGFTGQATETWSEMHDLLPMKKEAAGADIVFYGYDSMRIRAQLSANLLAQFLSRFIKDQYGARPKSGSLGTNPDVEYQDILVVAHSLGALVARRSMLDAFTAASQPTWFPMSRLLLFGPAHKGAHLVGLMREVSATSWGGMVLQLASSFIAPVVQDLDKKGSFVKALSKGTALALKKRGGSPLKAHRVVFGAYDKIVDPEPFCSDDIALTVENKYHVDVCKPTPSYLIPLEEVVACL